MKTKKDKIESDNKTDSNRYPNRRARQTKEGTLTKEEKLDETIDESFPASDPPSSY